LPYPTQYGGAKFGLWLPVFVIFSKQFQFFASIHPFCTSFEYFPPLFCIFSAQKPSSGIPSCVYRVPPKALLLAPQEQRTRIKMFDFFLGNVFELET